MVIGFFMRLSFCGSPPPLIVLRFGRPPELVSGS